MAYSKNKYSKKRRVWELQSQCYHQDKPIWTEEIVKEVVDKLSAEKYEDGKPKLVRWAWCLHDKDKILEENLEDLLRQDQLSGKKVGEDRPDHIHLVLEFKHAVYNTHLKKISGLPIEFIRDPNAKYNQFMAIATYLSHCRAEERAKGKALYPDNEIHCNFDYSVEVRKYLAKKDKYLNQIRKSPRYFADQMINEVERGEFDLEEAKERIKDQEGYAYYLRYEKELRAARTEFIKRHYEMKPRINYYIYGESGTGKSTISKYLAKALFPDIQDFECYYTVGAAGVRFDDYEYQPVIIWEDVRAEDLLREYKREGILNLMELSPKKRSYSIKYGKTTLTHQVNIFTGPVQFDEFVEKLLGSYSEGGQVIGEDTDKEQAYRRFPVTINVLKNEVSIYANDRIYMKKRKSVYEMYARVLNVDIAKLNEYYAGQALEETFAKITQPVVNLHRRFMESMSPGTKLVEPEYATSVIEVIEGYGEVKDSFDKEKNQYIECCEGYLKAFCFEDGSLGPYFSKPEWKMGDVLKGEYSGISCPFTFEDWVKEGRPKDMAESVLGIDGHEHKDIYSKDREQKINMAWLEKAENIASETRAYKRASERGENPPIPEGVSEEDIEDGEWIPTPTPEEIEAMLDELSNEETDYDDRWVEEWYPECFDEYPKKLDLVTNQFLLLKSNDALKSWVSSIFDYPDADAVWAYYFSRKFKNIVKEKWDVIKQVCIEKGWVDDEISWYCLYQSNIY